MLGVTGTQDADILMVSGAADHLRGRRNGVNVLHHLDAGLFAWPVGGWLLRQAGTAIYPGNHRQGRNHCALSGSICMTDDAELSAVEPPGYCPILRSWSLPPASSNRASRRRWPGHRPARSGFTRSSMMAIG